MRFLDEVIGSLAAVTPGDYIHLGGDEVEGMDHDDYVRFMWDACETVRAMAGGRSGGRRPAWPGSAGHESSSTGPTRSRRAPVPRRVCR